MTTASDGTRLVICTPADKQHRDRTGEIRSDFLNATSDQWLIEIKQSFAPQLNDPNNHQLHCKVYFAILDDHGVVLNSVMQLKLKHMNYPLDINTQVVDHTKFHFLDITKPLANHPTAWYLAI